MTADYLDLKAIAERVGIGHESARTYHKRATANREKGDPRPGDLPAPDIRLGRIPGWLPQTIDTWDRGRPRKGSD